ncbi:MAG: RHS repeat-associated core domain-containing protein, partial [Planctomycetaceae bacterium]|nr:RHS repeat-associated core domain-containing protein [Planctomycetaceae bacterium]
TNFGYNYDAGGNVIAELEYGLRGIDPQTGAEIFAVHTTTSQYDAFGQLRAVHDAADGHSYSNFDAAGHLTSTADRDGRITSYVYDAVGQLRRQTDAAGNITRYDYDLAGRQTDVIVESAAPEGDPAFVYRHQRLEFDPLNRVTKVEHFDRILGQLVLQATETTNYVYQNGLSVETATDQYNSVTMTTSDGLGHLVRVIRSNPDGDAPQTNFGYNYDAGAAMLTTTRTERLDATRWVSTQVVTNTLGGVLVNRDANNRVVASTFYDAAGHPTSVYEDGRGWTETVYDSATGQPSQIQQGNVSNGVSNAVPTEIQYDSNGNRLYLKDRLGNETWWDYDELGRVTQETTQLDVVDSQGLPTGALQSVLRTLTYHGTIAGLGTVTDYQDRDGRITRSIVSPDGQTLTERWYEPGADLNGSQTYVREIVTRRNAAGEILSAASQGSSGPMSTVSLAYDALGRPQFETQGIGDLEATIDTAWDDTARTTSRTFTLNPWGTDQIAQQLTYQRNALGQVVQVAQNFASGNSDLWANGSVGQAKRIDLAYMANGARDTLHRYRVTSGGTSERGWSKSNYAANGRLGLLEHYTTAGVAAAFANYTNQYKPTGQLESQKTVLDDGVSGGDPLYNKSTWFDYWADGQFRRIGTQEGSNPVAWEPDRIYDVNGNQNDGRVIGKGNRLLEDRQYRYRYDREGHLLSKTEKTLNLLDNSDGPSVFTPEQGDWFDAQSGFNGSQRNGTGPDPVMRVTTAALQPGEYRLFTTWNPLVDAARGHFQLNGATGVLSEVNFAEGPTGLVDMNGRNWQELGTIRVTTTGTMEIILSRANWNGDPNAPILADAFRLIPVGGVRVDYQWDHRGRLTSVDEWQFGGYVSEQSVYGYDALDRRIFQRVATYNSPTDVGTTRTTQFVFDGDREVFELDESGLITRANFNGLDAGEVWAVDDTATPSTTTVWQFADPQGTARTLARMDSGGNWIVQQRMFDADGELIDRLGATSDTTLTALPAIWDGQRQDVATGLYGTGSRVYDASAGRFINQASAATDSNPYRYDNGDPVNGSPFTSFGAFGYGVWDAILFGRFDDIVPGASGADAYAHQNGWYYGGMATAVVGQIFAGNFAAGAVSGTANAGRVAYGAARAYQAYSIVGDVVGVYDSYQGVRNGDFSPLNLFGFAPTLGWASKGLGGLQALGNFPEIGILSQRLLDDFRFAPRRGAIINPFSDVPATVSELKLSKASARQRLNIALGSIVGDAKAGHHLVPLEAISDPRTSYIIEAAARGGFSMNGSNNGVLLSQLFHRGGHPKTVERMLRKISYLSGDDAEIAQALQQMVNIERDFLKRIESSRVTSYLAGSRGRIYLK